MFEVSKTRLTLAMLARGWGNGDLMAAAGICKAVIQRLTTKGGRAANSTFFKIAKALNVEPTMLIKLPDDVEKTPATRAFTKAVFAQNHIETGGGG